MDDVMVYSRDPSRHTAQVLEVLQRLDKAGLQVDIKKCRFTQDSVNFLGFIVNTTGILLDPKNLESIRSWERPSSKIGV